MNVHAPVQQAANERPMCEEYALFKLQFYNVEFNKAHKIVSIPIELEKKAEVRKLMREIRRYGWHIQIGMIK